jgi:hypothetical protein
MNHLLLKILSERADFKLPAEDQKILDFFVEYLDHGSLMLLEFIPGEDPSFVFTNDAQHYTFSLSEIRLHYKNMKSGIAMNWEEIPFEYIREQNNS